MVLEERPQEEQGFGDLISGSKDWLGESGRAVGDKVHSLLAIRHHSSTFNRLVPHPLPMMTN